jgi:hypothetical protein
VPQRLDFKGKLKEKFKSSEKAPPLQKPQEWGSQFPNQLRRPPRQQLKKKNGINILVYPVCYVELVAVDRLHLG